MRHEKGWINYELRIQRGLEGRVLYTECRITRINNSWWDYYRQFNLTRVDPKGQIVLVQKMKKPTKRSLTRKLDKICSDIVRKRGYCAWCKKTEGLECCHIFSRRYRSIRWDFDNLVCLCHSHHFYSHSNPILFTEFIKEYLGENRYEQLKLRAKMIKKWTIEQMAELLKILKHP